MCLLPGVKSQCSRQGSLKSKPKSACKLASSGQAASLLCSRCPALARAPISGNTALSRGPTVDFPGALGRQRRSMPPGLSGASGLIFLMFTNSSLLQQPATTIGKYRVMACPRQLDSGLYAAQVSIASGRGSASTDRVMRFVDAFPSHADAAQFSLRQGIDWVNAILRPNQNGATH